MADGHSGHNPKGFDLLWLETIKALPARWQDYFFSRNSGEYSSPSRWDLCPDTIRILNEASAWSSNEQVMIGCLVSFYNVDDGQQVLEAVGCPNFVSALSRIHGNHQSRIFDLIRAYDGW